MQSNFQDTSVNYGDKLTPYLSYSLLTDDLVVDISSVHSFLYISFLSFPSPFRTTEGAIVGVMQFNVL